MRESRHVDGIAVGQAAIVGEQNRPLGEKKADEETAGRPSVQLSKEQMKQIEDDFELQTKRLNAFIA